MEAIIQIFALIFYSVAVAVITSTLIRFESKEYRLSIAETIAIAMLSLVSGYILVMFPVLYFYEQVILLFIFGMLSVSFYIDLKLQELPDSITALVLVGAVLFLFQSGAFNEGLISIFTRIAMSAVITILAFILSIKTNNLGMGDVKLLFPMLLIVGVEHLVIYAYGVLIPAFIVSLYFLIVKREKNLKIAFGPFMISGFVLTFALAPFFANII